MNAHHCCFVHKQGRLRSENTTVIFILSPPYHGVLFRSHYMRGGMGGSYGNKLADISHSWKCDIHVWKSSPWLRGYWKLFRSLYMRGGMSGRYSNKHADIGHSWKCYTWLLYKKRMLLDCYKMMIFDLCEMTYFLLNITLHVDLHVHVHVVILLSSKSLLIFNPNTCYCCPLQSLCVKHTDTYNFVQSHKANIVWRILHRNNVLLAPNWCF